MKTIDCSCGETFDCKKENFAGRFQMIENMLVIREQRTVYAWLFNCECRSSGTLLTYPKKS